MLLLFPPLSFLGTRKQPMTLKTSISNSFIEEEKKKLNLHHEIASIPFFPTSLLLLETYNIVESSVITRKLLAA